MNDPTAEASPVSSHPVMSKPDQNNNEDDKVSAAVSSPGPVLQSINRIMHREPLATIVHGVYWIVVLSVAVPVSLWVLVLRTLYLLVRRPRYLVFEQSERKEIESAGDDDQEEGLAEHAIFITGCDSGFGHELAVRAATATATTSCGTKGRGRHPFVVFAGCYNKENVGPDSILFRGIDNVHALLLDVTQDNHVQRAVQQVEAWLQASQQDGDGGGGGGEKNNKTRRRRYLHAVINNAGVGYGGDADWLSTQQIQHTMDVNYMGVVRVCKAFLPLLKWQSYLSKYRHARILNVTSMAGLVSPLPSLGAYGASKHAAQCWSESLRIELAPWNIQVATVNPTFHKTPMASDHASKLRRQWTSLSNSSRHEYGEDYLKECQVSAEKTTTQFCWNLNVVMDEILKCLFLEKLPMRVIVGIDGRLVTVAMRMLPDWIVEFAVHKTQPRPVPAAMQGAGLSTAR